MNFRFDFENYNKISHLTMCFFLLTIEFFFLLQEILERLWLKSVRRKNQNEDNNLAPQLFCIQNTNSSYCVNKIKYHWIIERIILIIIIQFLKKYFKFFKKCSGKFFFLNINIVVLNSFKWQFNWNYCVT